MTELATLTWPGARRLPNGETVLLVPLGATEQHGPHLPLATDTLVAEALARRAAERLGRAVVAPTIPYGASGEHAGFPGTLSLGQAATELIVVELARSADDFAGMVLVSTHGGNNGPVVRAVTTLRGEGRRVWAWGPHWPGDAHAGRTETSLLLALHPELVDLAAAQAGCRRPVADLLPELRSAGVRSVSANGVLGDPSGAGADEGRALLATAVDELVTFVEHHLAAPAGAAR